MGNILCCDVNRKSNETPKIVWLLDENNVVVRQFDKVSIASTPRSRNIAFHNHVPDDNECLLLPSSLLPNRLRTVHANRICSEISVLFCSSDGLEKELFEVQEQHKLDRDKTTATPCSHGDLIIQCGPLQDAVSKVRLIQ